MNRWTLSFLAIATIAAADQAAAQGRGQDRDSVPRQYLPPAGMCRIWLDNVPPNQQPAPTDCASAIRNKPSNARVIFAEKSGGDRKLPVKSLRERGGDDRRGDPKDEPRRKKPDDDRPQGGR